MLLVVSLILLVAYILVGVRYIKLLEANKALENELKEMQEGNRKKQNDNIFLALGNDPQTIPDFIDNTRILGEYAEQINSGGFGVHKFLLLQLIKEKVLENQERVDKIYENLRN